jgi:transcriptional regulator with XRE-family HTH domain
MDLSTIADDATALAAQAIKARREQLGLTLRALAARSGVSPSMISDVERATKSPTLATVAALASALETDLPTLLQGVAPSAPRIHVSRASDRKSKAERSSGVIRESLKAGLGKIEFMRYLVPAGTLAGPFPGHRVGTVEHVHVEAGRIRFVLGSETVTLGAGDSCSCQADGVHSFDNRQGKAKVRLYVIIESP